TAAQGQTRLAVDVHQTDRVARVDQVRVGDLRIDVPDLRPQPGFVQEEGGDIPQGVAFLDHIAIGDVLVEGISALGEGQGRGQPEPRDYQQYSFHRALPLCSFPVLYTGIRLLPER